MGSISNTTLHRDIGRVEGTVKAHGERLDNMDTKLDEIRDDLGKLLQHVEHEKGRRRGFVAAVSLAGTFMGAVAGACVQYLSGKT